MSGFDVASKVRRPAAKDSPIQVFVTRAFREEVSNAAHDERVSMSEFVRQALEEKMARRAEARRSA